MKLKKNAFYKIYIYFIHISKRGENKKLDILPNNHYSNLKFVPGSRFDYILLNISIFTNKFADFHIKNLLKTVLKTCKRCSENFQKD